MSLSPQFLDEVRARTTLSTLIGRTIKVTKAGREYKACCPFHNEKTPSFTINDEKGFYHCFGCGAHGDAIRWMTDQRGLPFVDAVKELADAAGLALPAPDPRAARKAEAARSLHDVMAAAQQWFVDQLDGIDGAQARAYLDKRGISPETRAAFGFGFAPDSRGRLKDALKDFGDDMLVEAGMLIRPEGGRDCYDRFRGRLMIPIRDARGRVIAFGGRILGAGEPKYLNSPDTPLFDKGRTLYNLDKAAPVARKSGRVIVVEGYMDVIALAQAGIAEAVAPLGTALTEAQIERLWSLSDCPLLCFDGDSAGQKAADRAMLRALPHLLPGKSLSIATLPPGIDPDDLVRSKGAAAFEMVARSARPLADRLWQHECNAAPTATPEQRAGLKARLNARVSEIQDALVRSEYERALQDRFFADFGWRGRKGDLRTLRKAIADTGQESRDISVQMEIRVERSLIRSILLGVTRNPRALYDHREQLMDMRMPTAAFAAWRDVLVSASYDRPDLEEDLIEAILGTSGIGSIEPRDLQVDLGWSFYHRKAEPGSAVADLSGAIEGIIRRQHLKEELDAVTAAASQQDADFERHIEQQYRLLQQLRQTDAWMAGLNAS